MPDPTCRVAPVATCILPNLENTTPPSPTLASAKNVVPVAIVTFLGVV